MLLFNVQKIVLPETFCNVSVLLFLLNHQASLLPHLEHSGIEGKLPDVGVDVVEPELVHRQERSGSSYPSTTMDQYCAWDLKENQ